MHGVVAGWGLAQIHQQVADPAAQQRFDPVPQLPQSRRVDRGADHLDHGVLPVGPDDPYRGGRIVSIDWPRWVAASRTRDGTIRSLIHSRWLRPPPILAAFPLIGLLSRGLVSVVE